MGGTHSIRDVRVFHMMVTIQCGNRRRQIHGFVTMHTRSSVLLVSHAKWRVRFILITSIFFNLFLFIKYLIENIFIMQATTLEHESSLMKLFVETHVRSDDRKKKNAAVRR